MQNAIVKVVWERMGVSEEITFPLTDSFKHSDFTFSSSFQKIEQGQLLTLNCKVHNSFLLKRLLITFTPEVKVEDRMMANGYQSWTQSREMGIGEKISKLNRVVRPILASYGDYQFKKVEGERGYFHSWTYTYFRRYKHPHLMIASIDESFAYTIFDYNYYQKKLIIEKEIDNHEINDDFTAFKLYFGEGAELELWDEYNSLLVNYRKPLTKCTGWTSWYNYYTGITEEILLKNLQALSQANIPLDVFQIDDGYQKAIGDWLEVNEKFPSGMKTIAKKIKEHGYQPGLWLAPFICQENSSIFANHPEWILRDHKGKPIKAGWNPLWKGWFYSLDFYAPGFQQYLQEIFHTILNDWEFAMLKIDFLYAVALSPRPDKSRGQIMTEALTFIREAANDNWILGCGVPLGSAFGQLDYCRIGSDVAPYWEDKKLQLINYRERISTYNSLLSTIGRWQLNGRTFHNDPDVFILRDNKNKLNNEERYTLFLLNNLLGGLVFFSDDIDEYSPEQLNRLRSIFPTVTPEIFEIVEDKQLYQINFSCDNRRYRVIINLKNSHSSITLDEPVFAAVQGYIPAGQMIKLQPHQSICLHLFNESKTEPYLLGTIGHFLPGAQLDSFKLEADNLQIILNKDASPESKVYVGAPNKFTNLKINGKFYSIKLTNQNLRYVALTKKELE